MVALGFLVVCGLAFLSMMGVEIASECVRYRLGPTHQWWDSRSEIGVLVLNACVVLFVLRFGEHLISTILHKWGPAILTVTVLIVVAYLHPFHDQPCDAWGDMGRSFLDFVHDVLASPGH
jgi:hypothetical protein